MVLLVGSLSYVIETRADVDSVMQDMDDVERNVELRLKSIDDKQDLMWDYMREHLP